VELVLRKKEKVRLEGYDMIRCYFNLGSKADISQRGAKDEKVEKKKN